MNKMQKLTCAKVLKVIFYLLGFPLLLLMVGKDSMPFFDEGVWSQTALNGINVIFVLWIGFALLQLGLYLVMKKHQALRTVILVIVAVAIMLAPVAVMDSVNSKKIEEIQANYADKPAVKIKNYDQQKQWFVSLSDKDSETDALNKSVAEFIRVYGMKGGEYVPGMYRGRTQLNTAPYLTTLDGTPIEFTGDATAALEEHITESPFAYNPNGLLYDGYIFGVENALKLLIEYNEYMGKTVYRPVATPASQAAAKSAGYFIKNASGAFVKYNPVEHTSSIDTYTFYEALAIADAYAKIVSENENATSGAWYDYTHTTAIAKDSAGNDLYYNDLKAEADQYVITDARLNDVLATLFQYLGKSTGINELIDGIHGDALISLLSGLLKEDNNKLNDGAIGNVISQLLYGYNDGLGGTTTGLALPAQYLFQNLNFEGSTKKTAAGFVEAAGGTITAAEATNYKVYVLTYAENPEDPADDPVVTVSYEDYSASLTLFDPDAEIVYGTRYYNGCLFETSSLPDAYAAYVTDLEANYDTPATAALVDLIKSLQPALGLVGGLLSGDTIMGLVGGLLPGLDLGAILNTILKEGAMDKIVSTLLNNIDLTKITVEGVQSLLDSILGEISYYQHPLLKMSWQSDFLSESDKALVATDGTTVNMGDYAWNKYACEDFGIANGCVLIAKGGLLAGKTLGNGASADDAFTLDELYQLQADLEYKTEMYPGLAARRYMVVWAGILALSVYMSAYFLQKEQKLRYEVLLEGGGF